MADTGEKGDTVSKGGLIMATGQIKTNKTTYIIDGDTFEPIDEGARAEIASLKEDLSENVDDLKSALNEFEFVDPFFYRLQNYAHSIWGKSFSINYSNYAKIDLPAGTYTLYIKIKATSNNTQIRYKMYNSSDETTKYGAWITSVTSGTEYVLMDISVTMASDGYLQLGIDAAGFSFNVIKSYIVKTEDFVTQAILDQNNSQFVVKMCDTFFDEKIRNRIYDDSRFVPSSPISYTISNANGAVIGKILKPTNVVYYCAIRLSGNETLNQSIIYRVISNGSTLYNIGHSLNTRKNGWILSTLDLTGYDMTTANNIDIFLSASSYPTTFTVDEFAITEKYLSPEFLTLHETMEYYDVPMFEDAKNGSDRIINAFGDSISNQIAGTIFAYGNLEYEVFNNNCVGGETVQDTLTRSGAVYLECLPCTIPASGGVTINYCLRPYLKTEYEANGAASFSDGYISNYGLSSNFDNNHSLKCSIAGIEGILSFTRVSGSKSTAVFTRTTVGDAVTIDVPYPVVIDSSVVNNHPIVCFMGTNGGWDNRFFNVVNASDHTATTEDADNLVGMYKLLKQKSGATCLFLGFYLCGNFTDAKSAEDRIAWWKYFDDEMEKAFGREYFSVRHYLMSGGYKEAGLTLNSSDIELVTTGRFPVNTCTQDGTHLNSICTKLVANKVMERMKELGMIKSYTPVSLS